MQGVPAWARLHGSTVGRSPENMFATRARCASPGIRAALAVLLGSNFENEGSRLAEMCANDVSRMPGLLTQAGCQPTDAELREAELLFAAATTRHGKTAGRLSDLQRSRKPELMVLMEQDLQWRGARLRGVSSPQPAMHGRPAASGPCIVRPAYTPRNLPAQPWGGTPASERPGTTWARIGRQPSTGRRPMTH
uniref:Uncharacterized protein n=1 Tax=Alexandrium monilatum TaxID=311494 RepID=A0A7S4WCT0_9DINO|mmetsp:Transcript_70303/g.209552  ORF Transcript_70303/g.209552 Transcript_70303/m.209552 type:complete len:193 (+) Transcript_70303:111-689(+)